MANTTEAELLWPRQTAPEAPSGPSVFMPFLLGLSLEVTVPRAWVVLNMIAMPVSRWFEKKKYLT